jgi:hypothetical protein
MRNTTWANRLVACSIAILVLAGGRPGAAADPAPAGPPALEPEAAAPDSMSAEGPVQLEWELTYASWYSFQGLDYSNRRPVLQPGLKGTLKGVSVGAWGNIDQSLGELNEADLTAQWAWERGRASGGLGYVNLQYPHRDDWEPSQEIFGEFAFDAPFQPSASVHWDVDKGRGRYWALGLGREIAGPVGTVQLVAKLYAQDRYYGVTGISALETRIGFQRVWGGVAWEPSLARVWSWTNGGFRGPDAVAAGWLISLSLSPP